MPKLIKTNDSEIKEVRRKKRQKSKPQFKKSQNFGFRRVSRYEKMPLTAHLAIGWSVFAICLIGSLIFSWLFVLWLRSVRENESSGFTNLIISLCLCITIVSALLVPVDVFLVSSMKNADGSYQVHKGKNKHQSHKASNTYDQNSLISNLLNI